LEAISASLPGKVLRIVFGQCLRQQVRQGRGVYLIKGRIIGAALGFFGGFPSALEERIARGAGREKQIGHAYLMKGSRAVATPDEFSARFRQDILPLLQEYAYDNFAVLADYLTPALVDVDNLELRAEILGNAEQLVDVLHQAFSDRLPEADDL